MTLFLNECVDMRFECNPYVTKQLFVTFKDMIEIGHTVCTPQDSLCSVDPGFFYEELVFPARLETLKIDLIDLS